MSNLINRTATNRYSVEFRVGKSENYEFRVWKEKLLKLLKNVIAETKPSRV